MVSVQDATGTPLQLGTPSQRQLPVSAWKQQLPPSNELASHDFEDEVSKTEHSQ